MNGNIVGGNTEKTKILDYSNAKLVKTLASSANKYTFEEDGLCCLRSRPVGSNQYCGGLINNVVPWALLHVSIYNVGAVAYSSCSYPVSKGDYITWTTGNIQADVWFVPYK